MPFINDSFVKLKIKKVNIIKNIAKKKKKKGLLNGWKSQENFKIIS